MQSSPVLKQIQTNIFFKTCAFGKCLKSNKWLMVKLLKNMHCNRLTTLYYQPILCLSFPPGSPLFAFHSCTLPWYSHISSIAHHHRKVQELWDARSFDLLSWLFKFLFIIFFPCQMFSDGPKPECQLVKSALTWHNTKASINQSAACVSVCVSSLQTATQRPTTLINDTDGEAVVAQPQSLLLM